MQGVTRLSLYTTSQCPGKQQMLGQDLAPVQTMLGAPHDCQHSLN